MILSKNRLRRSDAAAQKALRGASRRHSEYFSLSVSVPTADVPRGAIVVSAKVARKASERALLKRRCRAALAEAVARAPRRAYVLHAKRGATALPYDAIKKEISALFESVS